MAQFANNSLDPDVSDALHAALSSIGYAKSMITAYGKNSLHARPQKLSGELKDNLGEQEAPTATPIMRVLALSRQPIQSP